MVEQALEVLVRYAKENPRNNWKSSLMLPLIHQGIIIDINILPNLDLIKASIMSEQCSFLQHFKMLNDFF
jgi:hypothetical protein